MHITLTSPWLIFPVLPRAEPAPRSTHSTGPWASYLGVGPGGPEPVGQAVPAAQRLAGSVLPANMSADATHGHQQRLGLHGAPRMMPLGVYGYMGAPYPGMGMPPQPGPFPFAAGPGYGPPFMGYPGYGGPYGGAGSFMAGAGYGPGGYPQLGGEQAGQGGPMFAYPYGAGSGAGKSAEAHGGPQEGAAVPFAPVTAASAAAATPFARQEVGRPAADRDRRRGGAAMGAGSPRKRGRRGLGSVSSPTSSSAGSGSGSRRRVRLQRRRLDGVAGGAGEGGEEGDEEEEEGGGGGGEVEEGEDDDDDASDAGRGPGYGRRAGRRAQGLSGGDSLSTRRMSHNAIELRRSRRIQAAVRELRDLMTEERLATKQDKASVLTATAEFLEGVLASKRKQSALALQVDGAGLPLELDFGLVFEHAAVPLALTTADGSFVAANALYRRLFGLADEEVARERLFHPDRVEDLQASVRCGPRVGWGVGLRSTLHSIAPHRPGPPSFPPSIALHRRIMRSLLGSSEHRVAPIAEEYVTQRSTPYGVTVKVSPGCMTGRHRPPPALSPPTHPHPRPV